MRRLIAGPCVLLLSIASYALPLLAEPGSQRAEYERAIEFLLPLDVAVDFQSDVAQVISLRVLHPDEKEFLARIDVKSDGSAEIMLIEPDGERLEDQIASICREGCPDFDTLSGRLRVRSSRFTSNSLRTIRSVLDDLMRLRIPVRLEPDLYLDAPRVDVSVNTSMNTLRISLYGPGLQSKKPHPLITWADAFRRRLLSAAKGTRSPHTD